MPTLTDIVRDFFRDPSLQERYDDIVCNDADVAYRRIIESAHRPMRTFIHHSAQVLSKITPQRRKPSSVDTRSSVIALLRQDTAQCKDNLYLISDTHDLCWLQKIGRRNNWRARVRYLSENSAYLRADLQAIADSPDHLLVVPREGNIVAIYRLLSPPHTIRAEDVEPAWHFICHVPVILSVTIRLPVCELSPRKKTSSSSFVFDHRTGTEIHANILAPPSLLHPNITPTVSPIDDFPGLQVAKSLGYLLPNAMRFRIYSICTGSHIRGGLNLLATNIMLTPMLDLIRRIFSHPSLTDPYSYRFWKIKWDQLTQQLPLSLCAMPNCVEFDYTKPVQVYGLDDLHVCSKCRESLGYESNRLPENCDACDEDEVVPPSP